MPFIPQKKRMVIDSAVDNMWYDVQARYQNQRWNLDDAGNLAYIVYRIMLLALETAGTRGWGTMTRVWSDVALGAATYFKKYEIDPYEAERLEEHGPVTLQYAKFTDPDPDDEIPF